MSTLAKSKIQYTVEIVIVQNPVVACEILYYMENWLGTFPDVKEYFENDDFFQHTVIGECTDPIKVLNFLEAVVIDYPECAIARI
jgi:hypothetical protein